MVELQPITSLYIIVEITIFRSV